MLNKYPSLLFYNSNEKIQKDFKQGDDVVKVLFAIKHSQNCKGKSLKNVINTLVMSVRN